MSYIDDEMTMSEEDIFMNADLAEDDDADADLDVDDADLDLEDDEDGDEDMFGAE